MPFRLHNHAEII